MEKDSESDRPCKQPDKVVVNILAPNAWHELFVKAGPTEGSQQSTQ
jgi:hypothetical protein